MNKFYGFIYSRRTFYRAFGQWFALMFPHIEQGGETFDDVDVEDLAYWFWKSLEGYRDE